MAYLPPKMPRSSGETSGISSSADNALMKEIQATHSPDGREFSLKPLLEIVDDGFHCAIPDELSDIVRHMEAHQSQLDELDDKAVERGLEDMLDLLCCTINKVSCEISSKRTGVKDARETAFLFLEILSSYSWDAKVVLALAAFAVNYGEFWLAARVYLTKPLVAQKAPLVEQLLDIFKRSDPLKPRFDAVNNLISGMIHVAKSIFEVEELPSQYFTPNNPQVREALAYIPTAVYWTMRGIVACGPQIIGLIGKEPKHGESSTEASELSSSAEKLSNIHSHLKELLDLCYRHIEDKKHTEAYQTLVRLFESEHIDNMIIVRALTYNKEDQFPLSHGASNTRVSVDVLRRKIVLLFISNLDLSREELSFIYTEARLRPGRLDKQYDVVWLPVVEQSTPWNEAKKKQFETLRSMMPWYSIYHPSMLDPAVIRYIKEVWHFNKKPLFVVLDPQGRVVNPNAIHMMRIWGDKAYPFSSQREEALWKEETWRIELLADAIDPNILHWVEQRKYICLYGGEDIEWIRKFTKIAHAVAEAAKIQLEMLYVGESNPRENVRKNNEVIQAEKLSHGLPDLTLIWFFWERLESMWHSKVQLNRTVENDSIMQEILTMLSFDGSEEGWAVISKGSAEMAKAKGATMVKCFLDYEVWSQQAIKRGFVPALTDHLHQLHSPLHYQLHILPRPREGIHIDNIISLRALIYNKDDQLPLYDGSTKKRASLNVLRRKSVLLFISDLDLSHEDLSIVEQIYEEPWLRQRWPEDQYEVVWLPVVEQSTPWNEARKQQFENLQSMMPCYTVYHPSMLDPAVIRYIKEVWHFNKKTLLVVLDPQGRVVNTNAIHMMWIWGSMAYPFTSQREEALWKEETWRMELLADAIDPNILHWIREGRYICLYGGEDIEWIRRFNWSAQVVARAARIPLETIYVGKSNPGENVKRINSVVQLERISHVLPDLNLIWLFWVRLESMWHSKVQLNRTAENDSIMQEIATMLSFGRSEQGWAVISRGSAEIAKAKGETILKCFLDFEVWKQQAIEKSFLPALIDYLNEIRN